MTSAGHVIRRSTRHRPPRLFAPGAEQPRARRATDGLVVAAATFGLAMICLVAVPPAGFERMLIAAARGTPVGLHGFWRILVDLLGVVAIALLVVAVIRRRVAVWRDAVLAGLLALGLSLVVGRLVLGSWPAMGRWLDLGTGSAPFVATRVAVESAVLLAALPELTQPARRIGWSLVLLAWVAVVLLGAATPSGATAALLVAVIAAGVLHLAFGSCRGRPSLVDVRQALDDLGLPTRHLGIADRQAAGSFLVDAIDDTGEPLVVKVYGRDAYDTQLVTTFWRTVWFREVGSPTSVRRVQQAEHEAFLTLLAAQAGVLTQPVVAAAATDRDDVLLVLRPVGASLVDHPDRWSEPLARALWPVLGALHGAGVAHGQIDDDHLVVVDEAIGLVGFAGAVGAPEPARRRADEAQALVTTALAVGIDPALEIALDALGADRLADTLPFVQVPALTASARTAVRQRPLDLDDLRTRAAAVADVEAPELQRLRRVTWRSVTQVALLVVAFLVLTRAVSGIDLDAVWPQLREATLGFVLVGLVTAQLPRVAQAVSLLGASPRPVPLKPLWALQLAQSYLSLTIPTSAARIAISVRFFQRHGLAAGSALAVGALDGVAGFIVQVLLLASILLFTANSLDLDLDSASGPARLMIVVVAIGATVVVVVASVGRWRRPLLAWLRRLAVDGLDAARGLTSPRRLGQLFGGNLASDLLFAAALGLFTRSLGYPINLVELVFINISVSLLAGLLPIPGGIGVVEGGLTFGLVRAGVPEETALAAVLMYRLATFYLPPVWGFFALRWLERSHHL
jgi:glycosyltransferase 2 family protein